MNGETLRKLLQAQRGREPVAMVTALHSGAQRIVCARQAADDEFGAVIVDGFRSDRSTVQSNAAGEHFVEIFNPKLRLIVIGAVHIAQSLVPMAMAAGYQVSVIDPRAAFATAERFPGAEVVAEWPDEVLPGLGLDARCGFVALTHDPKIDDPALGLALQSDCFYIGALGSRKTQAARRERLVAAGFADAALARIAGPVGLDIGARGAPEIAISIMAEMTMCLRHGGAGHDIRRDDR